MFLEYQQPAVLAWVYLHFRWMPFVVELPVAVVLVVEVLHLVHLLIHGWNLGYPMVPA